MRTCAAIFTLALAIGLSHAPASVAGGGKKANQCTSFMGKWAGAGQVVVIACQGNLWIHPVILTEPEDDMGGDAGSAFTSLGRPLFNFQYTYKDDRGEHTVTKIGKFTRNKKKARWELPIRTRSEDWFRGEHHLEKGKAVIVWNPASRSFSME